MILKFQLQTSNFAQRSHKCYTQGLSDIELIISKLQGKTCEIVERKALGGVSIGLIEF